LSDDLKEEIIVWQVVAEGLGTLAEIETSWSLDDLIRAEGFISYRSAIEQKLSETVTK